MYFRMINQQALQGEEEEAKKNVLGVMKPTFCWNLWPNDYKEIVNKQPAPSDQKLYRKDFFNILYNLHFLFKKKVFYWCLILTLPNRSSFCWHLWLWTSILNLTFLAGCSRICIKHSMAVTMCVLLYYLEIDFVTNIPSIFLWPIHT